MLQIRTVFQRVTQNIRQASFAAKKTYMDVKQKANGVLPTLQRIGSFAVNANKRIQAGDEFSPTVKGHTYNIANTIDRMVQEYTGGVNRWNQLHNIAVESW